MQALVRGRANHAQGQVRRPHDENVGGLGQDQERLGHCSGVLDAAEMDDHGTGPTSAGGLCFSLPRNPLAEPTARQAKMCKENGSPLLAEPHGRQAKMTCRT